MSRSVGDELIQLGVPAHRVHLWVNAIDTAAYENAEPATLRGKYGIPPDARIITSVASVIPRKGLDLLLKAVGRIRDTAQPLAVVIVGTGDSEYDQELRRLARDHNEGQQVVFLGTRQDVPNILAASDVFVLASRAEAFGFALAEAFAAGLPCIAARVGGIPEFLAHEHNGLLFEREDIDGLERCLRRVLSDVNLGKSLGVAAKRSARELDLRRQIEKLMKVYQEALARGS